MKRLKREYGRGELSDPPMVSLAELSDEGYLQEANRRFFMPLGIAMLRCEPEDGDDPFVMFLDYRGEPGGVAFFEGELGDAEALKSETLHKISGANLRERVETLGAFIQPIPTEDRSADDTES